MSAAEQADMLADVERRIGPTVLKFYWDRLIRAPYFHMTELHAFVEEELSIAPASPDRVLRALRQQGELDYDVIDRRGSFYLLKSIVGIACFFVFVQPAFACHHFSTWRYPWPQSCRSAPALVRHVRLEQAPPAAPAPDTKPILIPPGWDEEQERREAIEALKTKLQQGGL
jgi:hypothetical protein